MKKILVAVPVLLALLVAAILVAPSVIDWNAHKAEITAALAARTGRALHVDGDIALELLPSPRLSVTGLRVDNIPGGAAPALVSLEALRVHLALAPLLTGTLRVTSVTLVRPVITLEILADGRRNWALAAGAGGASAVPGGTGGAAAAAGAGDPLPVDIRLDGADIADGTLVWRDHASGRVLRLAGLEARIEAASLDGPFAIRGTARYGGRPVALEATAGALDSGRAASLQAEATLADAAAGARFDGTIDLDDGPRLRGDLSVTAVDLAAALDAAGMGPVSAPPAGPALARPFLLQARIAADPALIVIDRASLSLGDWNAETEIRAVLSPATSVVASLALGRIDLDPLLPRDGGDGRPAAAGGGGRPDGGPPGFAFALPADLTAAITLTVDALAYRGGAVRQVRVVSELADGAMQLHSLTARLPGGTDLSASGRVTAPEAVPHFEGRLDLVSDNLRGALDWLGVNTAGIATDRLRKGVIGAEVAASPARIELRDWTTELDTVRMVGGLTLLARARPALGLNLVIDRLNLDAYLPRAEPGAEVAPPAGAAPGDGAAASPGGLALLAGFDANLRIKLAEAVYRQTLIREIGLDATLRDGALEIRDLSAGDIAGAAATVSGMLSGAVPAGTLEFEIEAASPARLGRLLALPPAPLLERIGPVRAAGTLDGRLDAMTVEARLDVLGGAVSLTGAAEPMRAPPWLDLSLTARHPEAGQLLAALAPGGIGRRVEAGPLDAMLRLRTRPDGKAEIEAGLQLAGGRAMLAGQAGLSDADRDLDLRLTLDHPDLVRLIRRFAPSFEPARPDLGGLRLASTIAGTPQSLRVTGLALNAGPVSITGEAAVETGGARPMLTARLHAGRLAVDPWLPAGTKAPAVTAVAPLPVNPGDGAWSRERIDTSGLTALDADIRLESDALVHGAWVIDKAELVAQLRDGVLLLERFGGGLFGGTVAATGRLAHAPVPELALTAAIENANLRATPVAATGIGRIAGRFDYAGEMRTRGASAFALVSALNGEGKLQVRDGAIEGFDLPAISEQLKHLDRPTDFLALAQRALKGGQTPFASLTGSYAIADGVVRSDDLHLDSAVSIGRGDAVIDLPRQTVDASIRLWLREHPNSPPIGLRLTGPLDHPRQVLELDPLQAYVLRRVVERGILRHLDKQQRGRAPAPDGAAGPGTVRPEQALEQILRNLLR